MIRDVMKLTITTTIIDWLLTTHFILSGNHSTISAILLRWLGLNTRTKQQLDNI